ncbi:MAG TPA: hypothetical protein VFE18_12590 [Phenylobacterium sp.]|jgi:hypothetical protein|uniref:hypothetical protein n=1 Tax=Phenylobacterium sp. TaxID=1871053 RepID=UPI002D3CAA21|nr:hypothetical protein [Phenylobacterium sp.]HZZ69003.1 hypothetical protein [Phenylobacterium sp.]
MARLFARHRIAAVVLALSLAPAALAQMPDKPSPHLRAAVTDYDAELARQCPAKRLDLLSPADLSHVIETFDGLSAAEQEAEQTVMSKACAQTIAGVSCSNMQMLLALHQNHQTPAFAAHVCALPKTCTAQSVCPSAKP